MKNISILFVLLLSIAFSAKAEISSIRANSNIATADEFDLSAKDWSFALGYSNYTGTYRAPNTGSMETGRGLDLDLSYQMNSLVSFGGGFAQIKSLYQNLDNGDYFYSNSMVESRSNLLVLSAYAGLTPIRYKISNVEFTAAVQAGMISANFYQAANVADFFGAQFGVNFENQIGLRLGTKIGSSIDSINTLSLVGYY